MIARTVYETIKKVAKQKPAALITGARQVGKTTLCKKLADEIGMEYVTLAKTENRKLASEDPSMFLKVHDAPLVIDEVQYAPSLFQEIESKIDDARLKDPKAHGLYVLTGSQAYDLMENVTQSMSGRIGIVNVSPISLCELYDIPEYPFKIDPEMAFHAASKIKQDGKDLYDIIIRGMYPELCANPDLPYSSFYSDYVESYIMKDVTQIVNVQNKQKFREFMEAVASLTGQELVYESITKAVEINQRTAKKWISVLVAGGIINLLEPYSDSSTVKRVSKRPKIYFRDTGLACYLAKIPDAGILSASFLKGPMAETFEINEIIKTHENHNLRTPFFYYRDSNGNEVDLLMLYEGKLNMIECKAGSGYGPGDIKAFGRLQTSLPKQGCIVCNCDLPYPVGHGVYALPVRALGAWR